MPPNALALVAVSAFALLIVVVDPPLLDEQPASVIAAAARIATPAK
jgi:hypothetical protein